MCMIPTKRFVIYSPNAYYDVTSFAYAVVPDGTNVGYSDYTNYSYGSSPRTFDDYGAYYVRSSGDVYNSSKDHVSNSYG